MTELVATIVLGILRWVFQMQSSKKLSNEEFIQHIKAHQDRRSNAGKASIDFEESIKKAQEDLDKL